MTLFTFLKNSEKKVCWTLPSRHLLVQIYNGNTRTMFAVCSKLTVKIPEIRPRR